MIYRFIIITSMWCSECEKTPFWSAEVYLSLYSTVSNAFWRLSNNGNGVTTLFPSKWPLLTTGSFLTPGRHRSAKTKAQEDSRTLPTDKIVDLWRRVVTTAQRANRWCIQHSRKREPSPYVAVNPQKFLHYCPYHPTMVKIKIPLKIPVSTSWSGLPRTKII